MLEKIVSWDNNQEALYITEINKHMACRFLMFTKFAHDESWNKLYSCRGSDFVNKFCKILKNNAQEIIN